MADSLANFAVSTVATAPSPATSGTSLVVASGQGALFPAAPFNLVVWPANAQPTTANAEIVRVTAKSTDTLTITRAQEGSSARTILVGDQVAQAVTAKMLADRVSSQTVTTAGGASSGWLLLLNNNYSPVGTDPEPIMVTSIRSAAAQRAFWLNESGSPRGASIVDEPALKLFGPNANTSYTGEVLGIWLAYGTQTHLWGINNKGQHLLGASSAIGGSVYTALVTDTLPGSLPSGLPIGTLIVQRTS